MQKHRLPMSDGQPNSVFADPEVGVIAIKNREDILYVSLYWRARYAINNLSRIHYLTPQAEWDATVFTETRQTKSKDVYTIPDRTNMGFHGRMEEQYKKEGMYLATAGLTQPIAKVPPSVKGYRPGKENAYAGKADLYKLTYGPYFIAMNCHPNRTFLIKVPNDFEKAINLTASDAKSNLSSGLKLRAGQSLVLYRQ